jgi:hypothetical protein
VRLLTTPDRLRTVLPEVPARINAFLGQAVSLARERFGGKLSYASMPFDGVDWASFDIIATDAGYRSVDVADRFREGIHALVAQGQREGKPLAITEIG